MSYFLNMWKEALGLWLEMSPFLLLGMLMGGVLHVFLREEFIFRHFGSPSFSSVLKATLLGIPLPLCSCGVIPVATSLRREGASRGSTLAFLLSTPTTGVDSILATFSLLGPLFAVFRPIASFFAGLTVGGLSQWMLGKEVRSTISHPFHPRAGGGSLVKEVFSYGFLDLGREIGKWLLLGVVVGGAISAFLPKGTLSALSAHPRWEFISVLAVSVPLYVCATGSIPIASALVAKGLSPGAALIFLVAGPATNTVTLSFVYSKVGKRAFLLYLGAILVISLLLGWAFNLLWQALGRPLHLITPQGKWLPLWVKAISASGLFLLLVYLLISRKVELPIEGMRYWIHVPDLQCEGCKVRVEDGIKRLEGVEAVVVDLRRKLVGVEGEVSDEEVQEAIREAGYTPQPMRRGREG